MRAAAAAVLAALVLAGGGCKGSSQKVEVVDIPADRADVIKVACSDETYATLRKLIEGTTRIQTRFEIYPTQSENVLELLGKRAVQAGVTSRSFTGDPRVAAMNYVPFAYDGAVFLASEDAGVRSLSLAQLRRILAGQATNWKEVGGADRAINVIGRPPYSSVSTILGAALFDGKFPQGKAGYRLETSDSAYQAMKTLRSFLAYAPISRTMVERFPVVPVAVEGMPPLLSNVPFKKYPGKIEYGLIFPKDAPEAVKELANFLVSVDGMHRVSAIGLAPASSVLPLSSCHCRATEGTFAPPGKSALAGLFTIAVVPERGAIEQERRYAPLSQLIADRLGVKTELRHLESYERVVTEFVDGRIDAAFVGSYVYAQLHARMGVIPIARPMRSGVAHYQGFVIVRSDSGIRSVSELRGRSLAYVRSTSAGELFVTAVAARMGAEPARLFSHLVTVPTHTEAVSLVEKGKVDAAAVKNTVFEKIVSSSPGYRGVFRVLESSPTFPENSLVVSPAMDAAKRKRLLEILLACDRGDEGRKALEALGADRFIGTTDGDYANLYALARDTRHSFAK